jgi:hypothetical protein
VLARTGTTTARARPVSGFFGCGCVVFFCVCPLAPAGTATGPVCTRSCLCSYWSWRVAAWFGLPVCRGISPRVWWAPPRSQDESAALRREVAAERRASAAWRDARGAAAAGPADASARARAAAGAADADALRACIERLQVRHVSRLRVAAARDGPGTGCSRGIVSARVLLARRVRRRALTAWPGVALRAAAGRAHGCAGRGGCGASSEYVRHRCGDVRVCVCVCVCGGGGGGVFK